MTFRSLTGLLAIALLASPLDTASARSIQLHANAPQQFDFGDIAAIPAPFGQGEFTFEIWVKLDDRYPVGSTLRATKQQLLNWSNADPEPYSAIGWWYPGNWLIDGHSRPMGFTTGLESRAGTFSLQVYGGGRIRWMFADGDENETPKGSVWSVQAYPAANTPSLLDGEWHSIACVRRWNAAGGADLELWVDGKQVDVTQTPRRVNMRRYWDKPAHPDDPTELGGWALGAEVMTAWDFFFNQYEDYKGMVDEMRFWSRARSVHELAGDWRKPVAMSAAGLAGYFDFEDKGTAARDRTNPKRVIRFHNTDKRLWSDENAPLAP